MCRVSTCAHSGLSATDDITLITLIGNADPKFAGKSELQGIS